PRFFGAIPAAIAVDGEITTNDGYNLRAALRQSLFALAQNFRITGRRRISPIGEGMNINFLYACLMRCLRQCEKMEIMTVHASLRNQTEQMQTMLARFLEALLENGIVGQLAGGERFVDPRQILINNPARAKIQVPNFGVPHLPFGQSDIFAARA